MSSSVYLSQLEQKAESLISEERFQEAYSLCNKTLKEIPNLKRFIKLKRKIEKEVRRRNSKNTAHTIKSLKTAWKNKDYSQIIQTLKPLYRNDPGNKKVTKLLVKAQNAYKEQIAQSQKEYREKLEKKFDKLLKEDMQQLIIELNMLQRSSSTNKIAERAIKEYRTKIIKQKIEEKEELIHSSKYSAIYNFISQLQRIDQHNKIVTDLEAFTKKRQFGTQVDEKNEFVYAGKGHLQTLLQHKKYPEAMQAAEEVLASSPQNKEAAKVYKKAEKKHFKKTRNQAIELLKKKTKNSKKLYKENPQEFIKV